MSWEHGVMKMVDNNPRLRKSIANRDCEAILAFARKAVKGADPVEVLGFISGYVDRCEWKGVRYGWAYFLYEDVRPYITGEVEA